MSDPSAPIDRPSLAEFGLWAAIDKFCSEGVTTKIEWSEQHGRTFLVRIFGVDSFNPLGELWALANARRVGISGSKDVGGERFDLDPDVLLLAHHADDGTDDIITRDGICYRAIRVRALKEHGENDAAEQYAKLNAPISESKHEPLAPADQRTGYFGSNFIYFGEGTGPKAKDQWIEALERLVICLDDMPELAPAGPKQFRAMLRELFLEIPNHRDVPKSTVDDFVKNLLRLCAVLKGDRTDKPIYWPHQVEIEIAVLESLIVYQIKGGKLPHAGAKRMATLIREIAQDAGLGGQRDFDSDMQTETFASKAFKILWSYGCQPVVG